ncbi:MAG: SDR family NAD(P)-dependent oxidoreductase [Geminicoccaceae bacterium]
MRVTLITGASSGIGAATARRLAGPGEELFLTARGGVDGGKAAMLDAVADEVRAAGANVATMLGDLGEDGVAEAAVQAAVRQFGRLDRIVSNAGYALAKPVGEATLDEFEHSWRVILMAFAALLTEALPHLQTSGRGRVVAVTSFVADQVPGGRLFPATAAAKGGLEALSRSFAVQAAPLGVTVNCVSPGFTRKESAGHSALSGNAWKAAAKLAPDGRLAEPGDVAAAIAFFLSDEARHITGQTLRVDGGLART